MLEHMSYYLPAPYNATEYEGFRQYLRTSPKLLDEFADTFIITLPKPRIAVFESPDLETIRAKMNAYFT